mgnify:FL=1
MMRRNSSLGSVGFSARGGRSRRRHGGSSKLPYLILIGILIVLLGIAAFLWVRRSPAEHVSSVPASTETDSENGVISLDNASAPADDSLEGVIAQAKLLADGYDYDGAINLLSSSTYASDESVTAAIDEYNATKETLVRADPRKVTHVFFHTLIMDTSKAFDGDSREKGYNQVMTTKDEFMKILQSMYERGFVLVRLHDVAYEVTAEDGSRHFQEGDIMLPEGKKPFVMSQDDVCYYEYMDGDGFASRMIIGEDGKPTNEMKMDDGSVSVGSYDLVPLLDDFIKEHPDFSYRGAKACIAFTGYNGILGYRTDSAYNTDEYKAEHPDFNFEEERANAAKVVQCLRDDGFEIASHSWGHRNMGTIPMDKFREDTDKWANEVETLTGPCDIILFPFGSDIGDWHPYDTSSERFQYLYNKGFRYFCNVDSSQYFVQVRDNYLRMGRRNLDGYRLYQNLYGGGEDRTSDLFDSTLVIDQYRPTDPSLYNLG